jgi:Flp pilus assembly protein TadD
MNRASVLLRSGDYASAQDEYRKVLDKDGQSVEARVGLGICLRGLQKYPAAEAEYQKALEIEPNNPAALFNLALLRADFLNKKQDARELFERFLDVAAKDESQRALAERYLAELSAPAAADGSNDQVAEHSP